MTSFGALVEDLNRVGVRYVVVGGIAVVRHGVVRATKDLAVVVGLDERTAGALAELMASWHATRPDGSAEDRRLPAPGWPLHLRRVDGLIDLIAEQEPPLDLGGLLNRAETRRVDGMPAPICALEDLVALKRASGRPTDREDLARLETAHGELPPPAG